MPTVHSSKFCFHIVAVCLWSRRPCHVHRERLPHMSVCVYTSWAKLDENADDIYFSSVFIHIVAYYRIVAYCLWSRCHGNVHSQRLPHVFACSSFGPSNDYNDDPFICLSHCRHMPGPSFTSACTTKSEVMLFLKSSLQTDTSRIAQLHTSSAGDDANHFIPYYLTTTTRPCTNFYRIRSSGSRFALRAEMPLGNGSSRSHSLYHHQSQPEHFPQLRTGGPIGPHVWTPCNK